MPRLLLPFDLLLHCYRVRDTGLYFVDSTKLVICHKARISGKGMFRGPAQGGVPPGPVLWLQAPPAHPPPVPDHGPQDHKGQCRDRQPLERITAALRGKVVTLFAKLKSGMGLQHSRHRSPRHAFVHLLSLLKALVNCIPIHHLLFSMQ